jgi:GNAT superfamily N-acetyltransferase
MKVFMSSTIRKAETSDVLPIVELAEQKRIEYQNYQPVFWRKAADSREKQTPWIEHLVSREDIIALVHERDGVIDGFAIADLLQPPPVYDAGLTCRVDDFTVAESQDWEKVGRALLDAVMREAKQRGAMQMVVVCGHLDAPKRKMLTEAGFTIASEWYVNAL